MKTSLSTFLRSIQQISPVCEKCDKAMQTNNTHGKLQRIGATAAPRRMPAGKCEKENIVLNKTKINTNYVNPPRISIADASAFTGIPGHCSNRVKQ